MYSFVIQGRLITFHLKGKVVVDLIIHCLTFNKATEAQFYR